MTSMTGEPLSARGVLCEGSKRLRRGGIVNAEHEAEWLLAELARIPALVLYLEERRLPPETIERFFCLVQARVRGTPLQYLLGEAEFCGRRFSVEPGVFIPRPETEALLEAVAPSLRALHGRRRRPLRLLDVGTGSGAIAVTLALELPACVIVGLEVSWSALQVAQRNAARNGVASRVCLVQGEWLQPIHGTFDGIISNPPYISSRHVDDLPLDVRQEPRLSLDGGSDGMAALKHLFSQAPRILAPHGLLGLECAEDQVAPLLQAARRAPWVGAAVALNDLASRPRGVLVTRAG